MLQQHPGYGKIEHIDFAKKDSHYFCMNEKVTLGKWSETGIDAMLSEASKIGDTGARIAFLSRHFLDTPYEEPTLVGGPETPEEFVVDLAGLDCFTFIDYIEAMRLASSFAEFMQCLREVRYKDGIVTYTNRNHFFTDWREFNGRFVRDITTIIGEGKTRQSGKTLNLRSDGSFFLAGITPLIRTVDFIPSASIYGDIIESLQNGDYVGIYTDTDGLDVSHVGIIIKENERTYLRHASSATACRKVVDRLFTDYMKEKPGAIVLRPRAI